MSTAFGVAGSREEGDCAGEGAGSNREAVNALLEQVERLSLTCGARLRLAGRSPFTRRQAVLAETPGEPPDPSPGGKGEVRDLMVHEQIGPSDGAQRRAQLSKLGLLPQRGEAPVWNDLSEADWFHLLRGMAARCPALAATLIELRQTTDFGVAVGAAAGAARRWAAPVGQAARLRRDCVAFIDGTLWHLWRRAVEHAETRPMFRRHLGDFPAVRYRLMCVLIELLHADEYARRAAPSGSIAVGQVNAWLEGLWRRAESIRLETQQICGGTGYMRESRFAEALTWLDWCDSVLRTSGWRGQNAAEVTPEIRQAVAARLAGAGLSETEAESVLGEPLRAPSRLI